MRHLGDRFPRRVPPTILIAALLIVTVGGGAIIAALRMGGSPVAAATDPSNQIATSPLVPTTFPTSGAHGRAHSSSPAARLNLTNAHPHHLVSGTLMVSSKTPLDRHQLRAVSRLGGVHRVLPVAAGHAAVDGHRAFLLGVDPTTFRPWTPRLTAASNPLWSSVEGGSLTASFDMGENAKLPLGATVAIDRSSSVTPVRIGAFASMGMAGVDAVVSATRARQIGLESHSGALISAPHDDPLGLRRRVTDLLGKHVRVVLLREVIITRDAGEYLTRDQIAAFLNAARSRIGAPYVWGAAGPDTFDCSGLVQWAFAQAGIRMPRVSEEQWLTGPHVPYADARPGDLLFWHFDPTDPNDIDHVAIYWGNGMMIEAPHTGAYVRYVPVPLADMAGVVRVDPALGSELS